ncbi:MAG: MBL fold metallo-hydrolase, partial [Thermodesulfobacteriota bacterium]
MQLGDIEILPLSDGTFRVDGGAMFGVVPKALWEKTNPPDGANRILLELNTLLIRTENKNILVETGMGERGGEKFQSIYSMDRTVNLKKSLSGAGLKEEDIDIVINTHLHFDHAGGNTATGLDGALRPAFPKARYIVQKGEFERALRPDELTKGSYRAGDFMPIKEAGLLELVEGDKEIAEGVSVIRAPGHTRDIQLVRVDSGGKTALFLSDAIPMTAHLKYPYIAGYDLYPLDTLRTKKEIIREAAAGRWLLFFYHDPAAIAGYVSLRDGSPVFEKVL